MNMNLILTFAIIGFKLVVSKGLGINQVLRIQMARISRQYELQKTTRGHQLKNKAELNSIKRNLKVDFQKSKNAMIRKLHRQQAQNRGKSIKTALGRTKRNFIGETNGVDVNKIFRSKMKNLTKEYNTRQRY